MVKTYALISYPGFWSELCRNRSKSYVFRCVTSVAHFFDFKGCGSMNTVNERVRNIRRRAKYNQTELGKLLGLKTSTYSQKERQGNFTGEDLIKLADIFKIDVREFLYDSIPETEPIEIIPEEYWCLDEWEEEIIKIYRYVKREQKKELYAFALKTFQNKRRKRKM